MGLLHPKTKLQKLEFVVNTILKRNLLDCIIKQNITCIVLKFFLKETYYCSIIAIIAHRRIDNMSSIMAII